MTLNDLKHLIQQNNVPNFLIFTGEEWKVRDVYIQQIAKATKMEVCYADGIESIWSKLKSKSLFNASTVYVLVDDKTLLTTEKIYNQIPDVVGENILILVLNSVDKRLKILKQYKDSIVEFEALKSDILKQYIQREIDLSDRNCEILMEVCDYNYGHCLLEIDKIQKSMDYAIANEDNPQADLVNYALKGSGMEVTGISVNKVFERLLQDGTIYIPPRDTMWSFIKAFLQNKPKESYELYQELKELETPTLAILSNLYNSTKYVYQVQTCNSKDIAKSTGLTTWQIRNAQECVLRFEYKSLEYLLKLIQSVETRIKQGVMEDTMAVDYIFTQFYGGQYEGV